MSGEVIVQRSCKWGAVTLRQGIVRAILITQNPDGSVAGPGDYFARVQKKFDAAIDAAMPAIEAKLTEQAEALGLRESSDKGVKIHLDSHDRDRVELDLKGARKLTEDESRAVYNNIQSIIDSFLKATTASPARFYRGPSRTRLLTLLDGPDEGLDWRGKNPFDGLPLGEGAPTAVFRREEDRWVIRGLVGKPGMTGPRPPGSWDHSQVGEIIASAKTKEEMRKVVEEMDWPWGGN